LDYSLVRTIFSPNERGHGLESKRADLMMRPRHMRIRLCHYWLHLSGSWHSVPTTGRPRRMIEECFEDATGSVGLDQYEVRRYDAWYRFMTLALLATRVQLTAQERALGEGAGTVPG
jgi:hypothetical protein